MFFKVEVLPNDSNEQNNRPRRPRHYKIKMNTGPRKRKGSVRHFANCSVRSCICSDDGACDVEPPTLALLALSEDRCARRNVKLGARATRGCDCDWDETRTSSSSSSPKPMSWPFKHKLELRTPPKTRVFSKLFDFMNRLWHLFSKFSWFERSVHGVHVNVHIHAGQPTFWSIRLQFETGSYMW